jgi:hypothetical protein
MEPIYVKFVSEYTGKVELNVAYSGYTYLGSKRKNDLEWLNLS